MISCDICSVVVVLRAISIEVLFPQSTSDSFYPVLSENVRYSSPNFMYCSIVPVVIWL